MTRKLLMAAAVVAIALTTSIGLGTAEAHGGGGFGHGGFHGGFHGGHEGFHHGHFRGGIFFDDPYFGAYPYSAAPAYWYFCPTANGYYPAVPSCPVPWQVVSPQ